MWSFPLLPEQASTIAVRVDQLYWTLIALSAIFAIPITIVIFIFIVRYRSTTNNVNRKNPLTHSSALELSWIIIPLALELGIFTWSSTIYLDQVRAPEQSLVIYGTGKQWMWKFQHPTGQREINELHVPVGQPVKMILASEDVLHSFFVPAFRVKQDVLPGRYIQTWFQATKVGEYHLFCAEYCGTNHSLMVGKVVVMEPADYQTWLQAGNSGTQAAQPSTSGGSTTSGGDLATTGKDLFTSLGCVGCHTPAGGGAGPSLVGVFGKTTKLEGNQSVTVDEQYVRESILNPQAKVVAGYTPIMPSFQGQVTDDQLQALIEYIRSLGAGGNAGPAGAALSNQTTQESGRQP